MNRQQRDVLAFIDRLQFEAETERVKDALGFTICAYDPEIDRRTYCGMFTDPVEAMRWANQFSIDLNSGIETDQPYVVTVEVVSKIEPSC